jgi:hypothetical protein
MLETISSLNKFGEDAHITEVSLYGSLVNVTVE